MFNYARLTRTSVVRLNDERRKSCDRSHYATARDSLAHTTRQQLSVGDIQVTRMRQKTVHIYSFFPLLQSYCDIDVDEGAVTRPVTRAATRSNCR